MKTLEYKVGFAGSLVLLEPPDMWNLWLTGDILHNQATVDH